MTKVSKQAKEIHSRWPWVEQSVWSERMLTALETGVKGGKWFSLIDKVWSRKALSVAFDCVAANDGAPGTDNVTVSDYARELDHNTKWLSQSLVEGDYCPQPIRRVNIPKVGSRETRPLGIPSVRDRVVQTALRNAIEPIFEKDFAEGSHGFRPGRSCKDALRRLIQLLNAGCVHIVDVDLKSYFDTIPHDRLLKRIESKISDGRIMSLIELFLKQDVMDGTIRWTPDAGAPQGAVLSPLLSNIYLDPLDHLMESKGFAMVRYADDFVIACRTSAEAEEALRLVGNWVDENGLTLHPEKTHLVDMAEKDNSFCFLGYEFYRTRQDRIRCWASKKSKKSLRDKVRPHTKRCNGYSMVTIVHRINPILRGWFEYFKHGNGLSMRAIDQWVRMRLRSILRKRHKGHGIGKGNDHFRWPNQYFSDLGLFSLEQTHNTIRQSLRGTQ